MNSKEALKELEIATNWSSNEDIDKDLYNLWGNIACRTIKKDLDRLEEYRKIEEELGIKLTVLFPALKYGVYYLEDNYQRTSDNIGLYNFIHDNVYLISNYMGVGSHDKLSYSFITYSKRQILSFKDYGKTWILAKEELEGNKNGN